MTRVSSRMSLLTDPPEPDRRFRTARAVSALMLREMTTTYGRSPGGYLWAVAEPVAGIALLSFAFSLAFKGPSLGTSFALFYATGYLPFMLYFDLSKKVAASFSYSRALLSYPAVTYLDALAARFALNFVTHVLVFVLVMAGLHAFIDTRTVLDLAAITHALMLAGLVGFGVGVLNSFLFAVVPVWERLWAIANRPMFILSAVLFLSESVPEPFRSWLWFNPLVHVVSEMRRGFYPTYGGGDLSVLYVYLFAAVAMTSGLALLALFHQRIFTET